MRNRWPLSATRRANSCLFLSTAPSAPPDTGEIYDIIAGDFFLCAAPPDSEHFESLTDDQLERYARIFRTPELFLSGPGGSIMVPAAARLILLPFELYIITVKASG